MQQSKIIATWIIGSSWGYKVSAWEVVTDHFFAMSFIIVNRFPTDVEKAAKTSTAYKNETVTH